MTMYDSAEKLNHRLFALTEKPSAELVNIMLEFGRVAKFRCRSNVAYKNFVEAVFDKVIQIKEVECVRTSDAQNYTVLEAVK